MILKARIVIKDDPLRETMFECDLMVDTAQEAREAGEQFLRLVAAVAEGIAAAAEGISDGAA